eukprot:465800_1
MDPTADPTIDPTKQPTNAPSTSPTSAPSTSPTLAPSNAPSTSPTSAPSTSPTLAPSNAPSTSPTSVPSTSPTLAPSNAPSKSPTACIDYESSFIRYNSNDGHDHRSRTNLSQQIQYSFYVSGNATVLYYDIEPTVDVPVPYINALIECDLDDSEVCFLHCRGSASCLLANIVPSSESTERVSVKCDEKFSCRSMTLNYSKSLSPSLSLIVIECAAVSACSEYYLNFLPSSVEDVYSNLTITDLSVTIYCLEPLSCHLTTLNIQESFVSTSNIEMHVNVFCLKENSCKQLAILNHHNEKINVHLWSFQYSEEIEVKTTRAGYHLVHIHCGNDNDSRYLRYDTSDLLNENELLSKARAEYTARRLPCEGIGITCSNIIADQVYNKQCRMQYTLSDMVDVTKIIQSDRNCFWIHLNELYTAQCYGNCAQNITIYEYTMSIDLQMRIGKMWMNWTNYVNSSKMIHPI